LQHVFETAGVDLLISDRLELMNALLPHAPRSDWHVAERALFTAERGPPPAMTTGRTAKISFTSGTTGTPKGVRLSNVAQIAVAESLVQSSSSGRNDTMLCLLPLAILLENVAAYAALLAGACICVPRAAETGIGLSDIDRGLLTHCLQAYQPSALVLVPHVLKGLVEAIDSGFPAPQSLRFVAVGGAVSGEQLLRRAWGAGLQVYEGYGLTEATSVVTLNRPGRVRMGSVGQPLPHSRVHLDTSGEILVRGALFDGYAGEPDRAAEFWPTGDLGHLDADGYLHIAGRRKEVLVTTNGRNISPQWIEVELTGQGAVAQAAVFGDGQPYLVALLVGAPGATPQTIASAVTRVNRRLPGYARIGRHAICGRSFSALHGEVTVNGRLRRERIQANFQATIESLYLEKEHAVL
jgi:long-subunit acyl-CoA synthetase (AMP-forming)